MSSRRPSRYQLDAALLTLVVGLTALVPAVARAASSNGPVRRDFSYEFTATQQSTWSYDNHAPPSDCGPIPAHGAGTQKATFTTKGNRAEVTSGLNANKKQANLNIDNGTHSGKAQGSYERQGSFVIENSKFGQCGRPADIKPDLALGTQGCATARTAVSIQLLLTGGILEVSGTGFPFGGSDPNDCTCPFMFYSPEGTGGFTPFADEPDSLSNDLNAGGLLGTSTKVSGKQFFKNKKVVLHGGRTQAYDPGPGPKVGFQATTTTSWTLTLKPKKKQQQ